MDVISYPWFINENIISIFWLWLFRDLNPTVSRLLLNLLILDTMWSWAGIVTIHYNNIFIREFVILKVKTSFIVFIFAMCDVFSNIFFFEMLFRRTCIKNRLNVYFKRIINTWIMQLIFLFSYKMVFPAGWYIETPHSPNPLSSYF